ncbi:hypothetical protein L873DRAFT_1814124 [Choiromyces venosus 120613-1]|uniref:Uncharacterized protein n=1 Tax=Choiromyces venosus 120613-1 TaxID=1336337 RepID=A0A3N4J8I0_9PEZI|nr:hypothetical protein L873DRAFT_1814124 [Choiromyces venosus 120613-1]
MSSRPSPTPPGFTQEDLDWARSQPPIYDELEDNNNHSNRRTHTTPPARNRRDTPPRERGPHEPSIGSDASKSEETGSYETASDSRANSLPLLGPPGEPCDFTWDRFKGPIADWMEGLEAKFEPFSDESWTNCTTDEGLYNLLHDRLVTRFTRQALTPNAREKREIHVICMLAKYFMILREDMVKAHLPFYIEEALSDAIVRLTMGGVNFDEYYES